MRRNIFLHLKFWLKWYIFKTQDIKNSIVFIFISGFIFSAGDFLKIIPDAYLNTVGVGAVNKSLALSINPAIKGNNSYSFTFADVMGNNYGYISLANKNFGFDYIELKTPEIEARDENGNISGTYNAGSKKIGFYISKGKTFRAGFGVSYIEEYIASYKAQGLSYSAGFIYNALSLSITNIGNGFKFIEEEYNLPSILNIGYELKNIPVFVGYRKNLITTKENFTIGGGINYGFINLTAGYTDTFTLGGGINLKKISLNYSFKPDLVQSHFITLKLK